MKYVIRKASDNDYVEFKTFNTTQALMDFRKKVKYDLIIMDNPYFGEDVSRCSEYKYLGEKKTKQLVSTEYMIMIYDDYME